MFTRVGAVEGRFFFLFFFFTLLLRFLPFMDFMKDKKLKFKSRPDFIVTLKETFSGYKKGIFSRCELYAALAYLLILKLTWGFVLFNPNILVAKQFSLIVLIK